MPNRIHLDHESPEGLSSECGPEFSSGLMLEFIIRSRNKSQGKEMQKTMAQDDLKKLIKESIREVLREERLGLCEIMIPHASKKELHEIHSKFGSPADYKDDEFTDMTDWVKG